MIGPGSDLNTNKTTNTDEKWSKSLLPTRLLPFVRSQIQIEYFPLLLTYLPPIPHALAAIGFFSRDDHHREPMVKYRDHVWKVNLLLLEYFLQEYRACQRLSMDFPSIPRVSLKTEGWHPAMHQL